MNKAEVRRIIRNMGLPEPQARVAQRTCARAMDSEDVEVVRAPSGTITITRTRSLCDSKQVFGTAIEQDGSTQVVQCVYDSAGNLASGNPEGTAP